MAVLTPDELAEMRRAMALGEHPTWTKSPLNASLQAIEDWSGDNSSNPSQALHGQINAASAPYSFTNDQKDKQVSIWRGFDSKRAT